MVDTEIALPLVVGVSTRAMFSLVEEHQLFEQKGHIEYASVQRQRENDILKPGVAFNVIRRLLSLNSPNKKVVTVVLLSKNSPDLSLRAFRSSRHYGLDIVQGSFTSGRSLAPFAQAWGIDLFLSNDFRDVQAVVNAGIAAAHLGEAEISEDALDDEPDNLKDEVRIALDCDAVVVSDESDQIFKDRGLQAFMEHESENAFIPMDRGPLGKTFLPKLALLRDQFMRTDGTSRVRLSIVTARNAPAHERVVHTLRAWGTPVDEAHFVGARSKTPILKATRAHIFFDDQVKHVSGASRVVSAGLVPGPHDPDNLVQPSEN